MIERLTNIIPPDVLKELPSVMEKFHIDTPLRLAHFLAQCAHESQDFLFKKENLNYSFQGLLKTFPKYFNYDKALQYERRPEKIANYVYANRMGNGNEESGEGSKFKGRGYIQLTGKSNYMQFAKVVPDDIISNPDLVATKYPLLSAGFFWNNNHLNSLADVGPEDAVIRKITQIINGGMNGINERIAEFKHFYEILK